MKRIIFSIAARRDLHEIDDYTIENFGLKQARRTRETFEAALESLAEIPLSHRARPEISPPGREFRGLVVLKSFIVVYELVDSGIRVARVLHGARDLAVELEREAGDDEERR